MPPRVRHACMVCYQPDTDHSYAWCSVFNPAEPGPNKSNTKRLTATDGTGEALTGMCVFFVRLNNARQITASNVTEV